MNSIHSDLSITNAVSHVLAQLRNVSKAGDGWIASCPVAGHGRGRGDLNPSLSLNFGQDGKLLVHCHAGCSQDSVLDALGLRGSPQVSSPGVEAEYDYKDEEGALLFQVIRLRPKDFRMRRPDGSGRWVYKVADTRRVPYRLPELVARPDDVVFIVEGEKNAEDVLKLGLLATTNPGGAGKWKKLDPEAVKKVFTARDVVIIPDNDAPGAKHAKDVARTVFPLAKSVKLLNLPDLGPKGDVSDWLGAGGTREKLLELVDAQQPVSSQDLNEKQVDPKTQDQSNLPLIYAGSDSELKQQASEAWAAVEAANDPPFLFRQGDLPVRLGVDDLGTLVLREILPDGMRYVLARVARWWRWRDTVKVPAYPPMTVVRDILATPKIQFPVLTRIVGAPIYSHDRVLVWEPGYHASAQVYYDPAGLVVPEVSANPTSGEVKRARALILEELLGDFPFVGPADRANTVGGVILLPFLRDMISGPTPLHLIEKPTPGTGASLMVDAAAVVVNGKASTVMTEGRDEDEWRKRITSALRESPGIVLIDNLRGRLDSAALSAALTAELWTDRLLGHSQMLRMPVRCAWVATGNNPSVSNEIARRTVPIRLDAKVDRPWERGRENFRHPNLRKWAKDQRGELVWASLTLVQNWLALGAPLETSVSLGSYEAYTEIVGGILRAAEIPGFLDNLVRFYERADEDNEQWRVFIASWWSHFADSPTGVSSLFRLVNECDLPFDLGHGSEQSQKIRLGNELKKLQDRRFGSLKVEHIGEAHRASLWRLVSGGPPLTQHSPEQMPVNIGSGESGESGECFAPSQEKGSSIQALGDFENKSRVGTDDSPDSQHSPEPRQEGMGDAESSAGEREVFEL